MKTSNATAKPTSLNSSSNSINQDHARCSVASSQSIDVISSSHIVIKSSNP